MLIFVINCIQSITMPYISTDIITELPTFPLIIDLNNSIINRKVNVEYKQDISDIGRCHLITSEIDNTICR